MTVDDQKEFVWINQLAKKCGSGKQQNFKIDVANGDDAFVLSLPSGKGLVFTTDTMVEGTHFRRDWMQRHWTKAQSGRFLGAKSIASNLSDLAAMGSVKPLFALVTLGVPVSVDFKWIQHYYDGMRPFLQQHKLMIAGGDIVRSKQLFFSLTLAGQAKGARLLSRQGAKDGDLILSSGSLGLSAAGLALLKRATVPKKPWVKRLLLAHVQPAVQFAVSAFLSDRSIASAALDTSDDLRTSLEILSAQNGLGAQIQLQDNHLHADLLSFCRFYRLDPWRFFVDGGEDYQLLFTLPAQHLAHLQRRFPSVLVLGRLSAAGQGVHFYQGSKQVHFTDHRFKHL